MVHLTLTGVTQDKRRLVLVSDAGVEFTLDVDGRLRAALRGDTDRLGQLEITMESTLRPRDIQARIRAGASPESVAEAGQTTVDRIM
ncbi:MAG TPA: septation protein SepH, partial [Nocardioides sp.]